jgi:hypothetical protein
MAGINWNVSVLPVRVLGPCGGELADVADGIRWAAGLPVPDAPANPHPAQVIYLDFFSPGVCTKESIGIAFDALEAARAAGAVVVAPAGDTADDLKNHWPAGCPGVVSVTAHDPLGRLAWYSSYGDATIMAPGGDPKQTDRNGLPYFVWSVAKVDQKNKHGIGLGVGTRAAAAQVAGALALMLAKYPDLRGKPDLIAQKLRASAAPVSPGACSKPCGAGQLDAVRLLQAPSATAAPSGATPAPSGARPTQVGERAKGDQGQPRLAVRAEGLDGAWLMDNTEGLLKIEGSEWRHPEKGLATIAPGREAGEFEVTYGQHQGVKCAYRISKAGDGKILTLEAADATQLFDYCPSGRLLKAD